MSEVGYPVGVRIKEIINETHDVKTFVLDRSISAEPGQFVMAWVPRVDEKPFTITCIGKNILPHKSNPNINGAVQRHAFEPAGNSTRQSMDVGGFEMAITVKKKGKATTAMHQMKVGDILGIRGPYGTGFKLMGKKIILVGGGYGTAPLLPLAEKAISQKVSVTAIIGADTEKNLLFADKIQKLGAKVIITTDDGSRGTKGFTTQALEKALAETKYDCIYTCGPEIMMYYILQMAEKNKLPLQASLERWMKCGFGICGQCVLDPVGLRVCVDGPVFGNADLKKVSDFGFFARDKTGTKRAWKDMR